MTFAHVQGETPLSKMEEPIYMFTESIWEFPLLHILTGI